MSTDDLLWYANLLNVVGLAVSLAAAFWFWRLTLRQEAGSDTSGLRRLAGRLQFSFAIIAAIATIALWRYSIAATKEADAKIAEAQSVADGARAQAGQAIKDAGEANERAGLAHARAAALEKEAAEARVKQAELEKLNLQLRARLDETNARTGKIESRITPRTVTDQQKKVIISTFESSSAPRNVSIITINDPESVAYGIQVAKALEGAGVSVRFIRGGMLNLSVYGSDGPKIYDRGLIAMPSLNKDVRRSLETAGIVLESPEYQLIEYDIVVGARPPTL